MYWLSGILLAVAASSDSFMIGLNYGVKGVRIGKLSNVFLSIACFCGTLGSMLLGRATAAFLSPSFGGRIGGILLCAVGLWALLGALFSHKPALRQYSENPDIVDANRSHVIELRESLLIGLILCANNIGIGIGAGLTGGPVWLIPLSCTALNSLFIGLGAAVGRRASNSRYSSVLEIASGALILLLGIHSIVIGA